MAIWDVASQFQFHKGTIKTSPNKGEYNFVPYFNSIKVQLKLDGNCLNSASPSFQFHKGTIKTLTHLSLLLTVDEFQFHKGTIKSHSKAVPYHDTYISIP